jgi:hypothetical protein
MNLNKIPFQYAGQHMIWLSVMFYLRKRLICCWYPPLLSEALFALGIPVQCLEEHGILRNDGLIGVVTIEQVL